MENMDGWDLALLVAAGYVAVVALVRLMVRRRRQAMDQFRREMEKQKGHREGPRGKPSQDHAA
jgi:hypothetical protein